MNITTKHIRLSEWLVYKGAQHSDIIGCININLLMQEIIFCCLLHFLYICIMKQYRLIDEQKIELANLYKTGKYNCTELANIFNISNTAIQGLLKRRGFKLKSQSELQRKYPIDENFFDKIDTEEKAYFLGILYADGYNNTDRNSINLSLKESDKDILEKLNNLLQPTKPLQFINTQSNRDKGINANNQYRLVIANKHISQKLSEYGCMKNKTFKLEFPPWIEPNLIRHFIRGYFDGDGYINKKGITISITSTLNFCEYLSNILNKELSINSSLITRHPERNHNIRSLIISGRNQVISFANWIYKNATIYLDRKYNDYLICSNYKINRHLYDNDLCSIENCNNKRASKGYCRNHYYQFCGGKEKRKLSHLKSTL